MSPRLVGFSSEGESQRFGEPGAMNDRERRYACRVGRLFSTERRMFICGGRGRTHRRCGPLRRATQRVAGWGGRKQILRRYAPQNDRGRRGARNDKERREDRCAMAGGLTKDGYRRAYPAGCGSMTIIAPAARQSEDGALVRTICWNCTNSRTRAPCGPPLDALPIKKEVLRKAPPGDGRLRPFIWAVCRCRRGCRRRRRERGR